MVLTTQRRTLLVGLLFAAFFGCFFSPLLLQNLIMGDAADPLIEGLPMWLGRHAAWEPLSMLGFPAAANPNLVSWYPLASLRFFPGPATVWYDVYHILAYWLAAMGVYMLIRGLTNSTLAGMVGGLIYALSGFMIGHAGHYMLLHPAAWAPWVLWSIEQQILKPHPWRIAGGAGALALLSVSGQPQILLTTLVLALGLILWQAPPGRNARFAFYLRSGTTLYFGLALASVALFPALELALYSQRLHMSLEEFTGFSTPILSLPFRLFFPYLLGGTTLPPYTLSAQNLGSFSESSNYVGLLGVGLATLTIVSGFRHPKIAYWVFVAGCALVLSTGNDLGIANLTYHVPIISWFRCPGRHAFEWALAIAVLAGYAIARFEHRRITPQHLWIVGSGMSVVLAALSAGLFLYGSKISGQVAQGFHVPSIAPEVFLWTRNPALWLPCALWIVLLCALVCFARWPASRIAQLGIVAAVMADMGSFAWFAYWNTGAFPMTRAIPPEYASTIFQETQQNFSRQVTIPSADVAGGLPPNLNILWHIPSLRGYSVLALDRTEKIYPMASPEQFADFLAPNDTRLDAAAVHYVIINNNVHNQSSQNQALGHLADLLGRSPDHWFQVMNVGDERIFQNRHPFPRAWTVSQVLPMSAPEAVAAITHDHLDLRKQAIIEWRHQPELDALQELIHPKSIVSTPPVQLRSLGTDVMGLDASCERTCFLVTSDVTYPGWQVQVDGVDAHLYPADATFRGVLLKAGHHHVDFQYHSLSRLAGWLISMCSLMFIAGLIMSHPRTPATAPQPSPHAP